MKFPVPCEIQEDESIPGFISRIVESNNYSSIGCVTKLLGITTDKDFSTNAFHKLNTGKFNIKLLSELSENSQSSLHKSLITLKTIKPSSKSDSQFVTKYWRICPKCINNNLPHQKLWMYSFVTTCPDHKVRLTDKCEKCGTYLRTSRPISAFCPKCDALLTSTPSSKAEIECAKVIKKATSYDSNENIDSILGRLMITLYMSSPSSLRARYRVSPQLMSVNDMGLLIQSLWKVAKSDKSLSQHIYILNQELESRWSYLPYASTLLENRVKELGVSLPSQETIALNETPLYNIQDEWEVPTEVASTAMGVSNSILRRLLKFGFIKSILFSQVKGESLSGATRLISLDEINSFVCKLHLHARPKHEYTRSNLSLIVKLDITQVLNDVLNNKVTLYSDGSNHINGLYVPYIETTSFKKRSQLPKNVTSTKDAALQLNINNDSIALLIKLGHLTIASTGNKKRHHIDSKSVTDFNKNYILVGSLAKELKINPTNLAEKLKKLGVKPITESNDKISIFKRSVLTNILKKKLIELKNYSDVTGRKSTVDFKSIKCPRVKKLASLVEKFGKASNFSLETGIHQGNLSMILHGKKSFGSLAAKRMEKRLGLQNGWFDS